MYVSVFHLNQPKSHTYDVSRTNYALRKRWVGGSSRVTFRNSNVDLKPIPGTGI
jgi:hypothetical protein